MEIPSSHSHVQASQLPLEMLAGNAHVTDAEKIGEVARQFEAVLLRQILQQARKTDSSDSSGDPVASGIYADMINNQLADSISRSGNFGLAKSLQTQLTRQVLAHTDAAPAPKISTPLSAPSTNSH